MNLPRPGIRGKLIFAGVVVMLAVLLMALSMFQTAKSELQTQAFENLRAIRESKATQIEATLENVRSQLASVSTNRLTGEAVRDFSAAFAEFSDTNLDVTAASDRVETYYDTQFLPRLVTAPGQTAPSAQSLFPTSATAVALQDRYIASNPYPVGDKDTLGTSGVDTPYDRAHARYHSTFRSFLDSSGFYDLFLIDNDGNIVYTVFKEIDFATSLRGGPHSYSGLGRVFRDAKVYTGAIAVDDFAPYEPSYNAPAAFFADAVYLDSVQIGVVAVQAPIDAINDVMTSNQRWESVGLGESGETYLVADDLTMRNDSRFLVEDRSGYFAALIGRGSIPFDVIKTIDHFDSSIGLQTVRTEGVLSALEGGDNEAVFPDYRGVSVLSSYRSLDVPDLNWAIMSEIDQAEAFKAVDDVRDRTIVMILIGGGVLMTGMFLLATRISRPIRALEVSAADLSSHDFTSRVPYTSDTLTSVAQRHDEIGELAQAFQKMGGDLSESVLKTLDAVEAREMIEAELSVANEIQRSMLPLTFPEFPEHTGFAIHARLVPATEVGGDFYEFGFVGEDRLFFCVGDVSGKGVPAALFMAATKTLLRSGALQGDPPGELLTHINAELSRENPEFMFATIWLGVLDLRTGLVTFSNGGHNPPLIRSTTMTWVEDMHGPMVGPMQGTTYGSSQVQLEPGDILVVYSDGVTEAMNPSGSLFGEERLCDVVVEAPPVVTALTEAIETEALEWEVGDRSDDLTVLAIQYLSPRRVAAFQMVMPTQGELSEQIVEDIHLLNDSFFRFAQSRKIDPEAIQRVQVALDEILVNVAAHSGATAVTVQAWLDAGELQVQISDDGTPFNPLIEAEPPDITGDLEDRELGGLGIHLVQSLMDHVEYTYRGGRNIVTLTKQTKENS